MEEYCRRVQGEKTTLVPPRFELGIAGCVAAGVVTVTPRMCLTNENVDIFIFYFFHPPFTSQSDSFASVIFKRYCVIW